MYPRNIFTCVKIHIKRNKDEHIVMKQWIIDEDEFNFSQRYEKKRHVLLTCSQSLEYSPANVRLKIERKDAQMRLSPNYRRVPKKLPTRSV